MNAIENKTPQGNPRTAAHYEFEYAALDGNEVSLFAIVFDFVRRHLWTLLVCVLIGASVGIVYFVVTPTTYVATATLAIENRRFQLFPQAGPPGSFGEQLIDSMGGLESQIEFLRSDGIALRVIKDLQLADDPEFAAGPVIPIISLLLKAGNLESGASRTQNSLRVFERNLKVKRLGVSYVIEVAFESASAERAAQIANAVTEAYIAEQAEGKYKATRLGSNWLQHRLKELRDLAADAQKASLEYKAANKIVEAGAGRLITDQQLTELNTQLTFARAKTSEARARLDQVTTILKRGDLTDATIFNVVLTDDAAISKLRGQYVELATRESEFSQKYGQTHLAVVNLRNQMRAVRTAIQVELQRLAETYKGDFNIASESEKYIEARLQQAVAQSQTSNEAQVNLRDIDATAQTYKSLHDYLLRRYAEAVEQQSFGDTEARFITRATPPVQGSYRKMLLVAAMTPFVGLFFGAGIGALRDFFDRGFRTSTQVETLLNTNCLAVVPVQKTDPGQKPSAARGTGATGSEPRQISHDGGMTWTVLNQPFSRFAEAIRTVKLAADLNGVMASNKVVGITSSVPSEGKSTISVALAQSIAQTNVRVLLVDCDLRNPSLSRAITPDAAHGILEVLSGKESLANAVWNNGTLSFLPAVIRLRMVPSGDILASLAMRKLFEKFRASYDLIIVDLPPLAPIVDVRATTDLVDSYILIVEWGRTYTAVAQHALSRVPHVRDKLLGAVLNKVDIKSLALYDGDRARYYHDKAYGRYGYTD